MGTRASRDLPSDVGRGVGVKVGVKVRVGVGVRVGVAEGVGVVVLVGVLVGDGVDVGVNVTVAVAVRVRVRVGEDGRLLVGEGVRRSTSLGCIEGTLSGGEGVDGFDDISPSCGMIKRRSRIARNQ